jgi:nitrogen fixation/metabolism regulation signal transduction histidine kinase
MRRKYILDRKWQLSVSLSFALVALAAAAVHLFLLVKVADQDPIEKLSGDEIGILSVGANLLYALLTIGGVLFVGIRHTHKVAGPAMVLERAVRAMNQGQFDSRLSLRKGDYLQELAGAIKELSTKMQTDRELVRELSAKLCQALERNDQRAAREISAQLAELYATAVPETVKAAA